MPFLFIIIIITIIITVIIIIIIAITTTIIILINSMKNIINYVFKRDPFILIINLINF